MEFNQSERCEHFSSPERSVSLAVYILLYVCLVSVVLLTVCGNLLIIISVLHFKQLQTPSNTLVLSLAVSDFLIGALVMLPELIRAIETCWVFGRDFCISFLLISAFLMDLSFYNVALIAVDRYLSLSNPFLYTNRVTRRTTWTVVYFNCCLCLTYITAIYYFNRGFMSFAMCSGECVYFLNEVCSIIDLVVSFIFPFSVIIILYTRIFVIAKKHATAIRELNKYTRSKRQKVTSHSMKSERKAAKVLCILASVFLVCLLPSFIYSLFGNVIELQAETIHKLLILIYINSTINPFIYALFYPWFRKCIKLIITLKIFQTDSVAKSFENYTNINFLLLKWF